MAISLYTGLPGAGKSYEVIKNVILPALASGRVVVTNLDGFDVSAAADLLEKDGAEAAGEVVVFARADLLRPGFFPVRSAAGGYVASQWVPLGALVVVDEAPFVWGSDRAILPAHLEFFREHRHITSSEGVACDLVVISQTVDALHRSLRSLVEFSVDCRRLVALGLNRKYTAVSYQGAKRSGKYVMGRATHTYDRRVFAVYRSFTHSNGRVLRTDRRSSVWSQKWFWGLFALAPVLLVAVLVHLWHNFFDVKVQAATAVRAGVAPLALSLVHSAVPLGVSPASATDTGATVARNIGGEFVSATSPWKIVGAADFEDRVWVVIRRDGFPLRYLPSTFCRFSFGFPVTCDVGGEVFEPSGGAAAGPAAAGGSAWLPDIVASHAHARVR